MELYILSKQDLSILSICKLADYQINLDEETNAKSTFTLMKTNGLKKGNYMTLNGLYRQFIFVIDDVQTEKESDVVTVTALDISNVFNRKVIEKNIDTMKSKSIEEFLANTISENFVNSNDTALNVNYIEIYWHTNTQGNVATNAENGLYNFHTFLTNCRQYKNIYTDFKLENLGNPQTVEGKRINVEAKNRKIADIMLEGESQQATRSGKNLYDVNDVFKFTDIVSVDNDDWITVAYDNSEGTSTKFFDFKTNINQLVKTSQNYKLIVEVKNISGTGVIHFANNQAIGQVDTTVALQFSNITTGVHIYNIPMKSEFTSCTNFLNSYGSFLVGTSGSITFRMSVLEDTTITADDFIYEQYGVSPSPDYPSPIENVEGKNKFDINQEKEIFGIMLYKYSYYLKPNTKYTISSNCPASTTANIYANSNSSNSAVYINKNQTIQSDENGYFYILVRFKADASDNSTFNLYEKVLNGTYYIQLEEGTVATPYVPYNSLEFKDEGKNKFDCANSKIIYNNGNTLYERLTNGLKIISSGGQYNMLYFLVDTVENLKGKTLTLSSDILFSKENQLTMLGLFYTDTNGGNRTTLINNSNITSKGKYQVAGQVSEGENRYYVCIGLRPNMASNYASGDYTIYDNLQVEIGETATAYEPYKSQVATFPLGEEKLMEGSYLADDGIHHKRKQISINSSLGNYNSNDNWYYISNSNFANLIKAGNSLSNYFTYKPISYLTSNPNASGVFSNTRTHFVFRVLEFTSAAEYRNFFTENSVIIEYDIAEEEIVPYTEEQQEAWNNIKNLTLFEGVNHISSEANMFLKYYPLKTVGLKFVLRIDIENKQETTELIDTTLSEVTDYNKIYEEDVTAKVQVYIREDGSEYNLYLKTDRTTTTNKDDPDRASGKIEVISVETADKAEEEALNVMKGNNYKHLVEFKITKTSKLMDITKLHIRKTYKNQNRRRYI